MRTPEKLHRKLSIDAALAYIAADRRAAMARGESLLDRAEGTALFADISGFTPLTEALTRELGPKRGAEELTRQLDRVYGALIAELARHRGSVVNFAGDAITCWLDGDDGSRAIAAGLAMQQVMGLFSAVATPSGSTVALTVKIAIARGPARRFRVGNPDIQYIDVLAGRTLERMAEAEHHADKGEVVVSEEVVASLGEALQVSEWRESEETGRRFAVVSGVGGRVSGGIEGWESEPTPDTLHPALTDEQVRPWLLPKVYERLKGGQGQFLAEIRPAVALFLRFGGIDYDRDPVAGDKLDAYIRWVQGIVARMEGSLVQLTTGDKGSYLYSVFGAPVAHDDDAQRAVAAALEMQRVPPELGYVSSVQIGITRGRVRAGAYGGPTRRTYGALGDEVNLAARLMSRASPGEILVNERVAQSVRAQFGLEGIGAASVKGKAAPVMVYRVQGRSLSGSQNATAHTNLMVGREAELEEIEQTLNVGLRGRGQVLRIEGPAGIGKSHLAAALIEKAKARGARVAVGVCQSTTVGTAYAPWRQVFYDLLGLADPAKEAQTAEEASTGYRVAAGERDPRVAALEVLVTRTQPEWLVRLPLLGDLLGLPIPDNPTTAAFEPKLRQSALLDLVGDIVETLSHAQPLLLLLDDVHWMDAASEGLAVALGRRAAGLPLVMAVVHRPPYANEAILSELDPLPTHRKLNLAELSPQGVGALLANRLGGPVGPLALAVIQALTQGNPFFAEELVDSLRESGKLYRREDGMWMLSDALFASLREAACLTRQEGRWSLAHNVALSSVDLGIPDSVQGVVLTRFDRLPEEHKLTLKTASVIGHIFALDVLALAHPLRPEGRTQQAESSSDELPSEEWQEALRRQVELLEERDFARLEAQTQSPTYIFKHNITRDVAYETLLSDQRRELHRAVGEALERLAADKTGELAYHTFLGEDWVRALRYQSLAGEQAQRLFANHEGIEHFKKALISADRCTDADTAVERGEIHSALGELLTATAQYEAALEQLSKALQLSVENRDAEGQARASRWIARVHENRGEYPQALGWIDRGLQALGSREAPATAELLAIAGLIQARRGEYTLASESGRSGLRIAEKLGDLGASAFAHNLLGHISRIRGDNAEAIDHFQRALELYERNNNVSGQAISHNQIANAFFNIGRWTEADQHYREASAIFNRIGDLYNYAFVANNLGGIALNQGRLDEALAFYRESLGSLERIGGSPYVIGVLQMNLGATFVRRGEQEAAEEHLGRALDYLTQADARDFLPELHRHFAECTLRGGDLGRAAAYTEQALALARELAMRGEEGISLRVMGELAVARRDAAQAERHLLESIAILEELGEEYELARSRLTLARLCIGQGRAEEACNLLSRCEAVFRRLDAALDLASLQVLQSA